MQLPNLTFILLDRDRVEQCETPSRLAELSCRPRRVNVHISDKLQISCEFTVFFIVCFEEGKSTAENAQTL